MALMDKRNPDRIDVCELKKGTLFTIPVEGHNFLYLKEGNETDEQGRLSRSKYIRLAEWKDGHWELTHQTPISCPAYTPCCFRLVPQMKTPVSDQKQPIQLLLEAIQKFQKQLELVEEDLDFANPFFFLVKNEVSASLYRKLDQMGLAERLEWSSLFHS